MCFAQNMSFVSTLCVLVFLSPLMTCQEQLDLFIHVIIHVG